MSAEDGAARPLRVVLHAHSEWSYDAEWPLERVARAMARLGADAVMMTEHDTGFPAERFDAYRAACAAASTPRCAVIPGIEYSSPDNSVHVLTWGLDRFLGASRPTGETLKAVAEAGGAAVFAHPARRDVWRIFDPAWAKLLSGMEVWNRKTDGVAPGREALRLARRHGLPATVGMDFHRRNQLWPLTNLIAPEMQAGEGLEAGLVAALRAGRVTPCAFGAPLLDAAGEPASPWHGRAEALRRGLKRLRPRRR